jgi:hypothetical protein
MTFLQALERKNLEKLLFLKAYDLNQLTFKSILFRRVYLVTPVFYSKFR